jgi:hypothetical protein
VQFVQTPGEAPNFPAAHGSHLVLSGERTNDAEQLWHMSALNDGHFSFVAGFPLLHL